MELVPIDERQLQDTMENLERADYNLIMDYCGKIQTILNSLVENNQTLTIDGAAAGENAVQRIAKYIADSGANRAGFVNDMEIYIDRMKANRSMISQMPRDAIQVYGKAMTTGVISTATLYSICWWNFTSTLSTLASIVAMNPVMLGAVGGVAALNLQEFGMMDYLGLLWKERPEYLSYNDFTLRNAMEHVTENAGLEDNQIVGYLYSFFDTTAPAGKSVLKAVDAASGNVISYKSKMAELAYEQTVETVDQLFNIRDQFINITLMFTAMMIVLLLIIWGTRLVNSNTFKRRTKNIGLEMLNSPMGGRAPRRRSRSRRMNNTAVKRSYASLYPSARRKSTRRKSTRRKSTRRKSTRRKSKSPKRKGMSKRRKSRRKSKSPKRKSKSKRRKSRRKSKSPKRKSKSRRRKSRRKSKSPKRKGMSKRRKSRRKSKSPKRKGMSKRRKSRRKSKSRRRKSTRKGQVRKTSRRAYMDLKTKPRRRSRSRRRKDMM